MSFIETNFVPLSDLFFAKSASIPMPVFKFYFNAARIYHDKFLAFAQIKRETYKFNDTYSNSRCTIFSIVKTSYSRSNYFIKEFIVILKNSLIFRKPDSWMKSINILLKLTAFKLALTA